MVLRIFLILAFSWGCGKAPNIPDVPASIPDDEEDEDQNSEDQLPEDQDDDKVKDPEQAEHQILKELVKLAVGHPECPYGGIEEIVYEDIDDSGDLSKPDKVTTKYMCNASAPVLAYDAGYGVDNDAASTGVDFKVHFFSAKPAKDWVVTTTPKSGTITGTFPDFHYTPNPGHQGRDEVLFRVEDSDGFQSNEARAVFVTKPKIVLIGAAVALKTVEQRLEDQLKAHFGADTLDVPVSELGMHTADLANADLVIVKGSAFFAGGVIAAVQNLDRPVLLWNENYYDPLDLEQASGDREAFLKLQVLDKLPPVTDGYTGQQQIYQNFFDIRYSTVGAEAVTIGSSLSSPAEAAVFLYLRGSKLVNGTMAIHNRGGFMSPDLSVFNDWTPIGLELFLRLASQLFL
ncbi:MAG: hypothetical protein AB7T49_16990 [Oligoflexales bacterium]